MLHNELARKANQIRQRVLEVVYTLQMWATLMSELDGKEVKFGCVKPEHTHMSHSLITAALDSYAEQKAVKVTY